MELIRLAVDAGLCVLVWLVQVIIYPSFLYTDRQKLKEWHARYTRRITYFIAPLLFLETGIIAYQIVFEDLSFLIDGLFLAIIWSNTFFVAVPIHNAIDRNHNIQQNIRKLISVNRWRTLAWSALFLLALGRGIASCSELATPFQ